MVLADLVVVAEVEVVLVVQQLKQVHLEVLVMAIMAPFMGKGAELDRQRHGHQVL